MAICVVQHMPKVVLSFSVLNEVYVGTSYTRLVDVEKNTEGFIYLLDADSNKLIKVSIPE